jgi:NAD(P)-dependent dehydrogenase (short-subunit alcohol dehydrogenase family)
MGDERQVGMAAAATDRTVIILSASSDIGQALAARYLAAGATVVGTYRSDGAMGAFASHPRAHLFRLDLNEPQCFSHLAEALRQRGLSWDLFVASNGTMEPIGPFLEVDGEAWQNTICANALLPCRLLQSIYPLRRVDRTCTAVFFAGGGTNNPFRNYSAYCISKIVLIKMCELLHDEAEDLKSFILGPGYVRTKIHDETLRAGGHAGANLEKTRAFLATDGTSMDDIYDCIEWGVAQDRAVIGGRNISIVHDPWQNGGQALASALAADADMYKLRRAGNLWKSDDSTTDR